MRKALYAVGIIAALTLTASPAFADHPQETDGTSYTGDQDYGPIPYGPVFTEDCKTVELDPPSYVWVTLHFDYGDETAHDVFPYEPEPTNLVTRNIASFVEGKVGELWGTWNLGTGETARVPFDCVPDAPETTTTTTSTTVPVEPVNTDHETVVTISPTEFVEIGEPAEAFVQAAPVAETPAELPRTGVDPMVALAGLTLTLLGAGVLFVLRAGRDEA